MCVSRGHRRIRGRLPVPLPSEQPFWLWSSRLAAQQQNPKRVLPDHINRTASISDTHECPQKQFSVTLQTSAWRCSVQYLVQGGVLHKAPLQCPNEFKYHQLMVLHYVLPPSSICSSSLAASSVPLPPARPDKHDNTMSLAHLSSHIVRRPSFSAAVCPILGCQFSLLGPLQALKEVYIDVCYCWPHFVRLLGQHLFPRESGCHSHNPHACCMPSHTVTISCAFQTGSERPHIVGALQYVKGNS